MLPGKGDLILFREDEDNVAIAFVIERHDFSCEDSKKRTYMFELHFSAHPLVRQKYSMPIASWIRVCYTLKDIRKRIRDRKWQIIYNTNPLQRNT